MENQGNESYLAQNKGPWLTGIFCSLLGVSLIVAGLRLYCRLRLLKIFLSSDYLILLALITTSAMSVTIYRQIQTGMGRHVEYSLMHPGMLRESMKFGYAENILYQVSVGIVKSSILMQYHHFSATRTQRKIVLVVVTFTVCFCAFTTLSAIIQCIPISAVFNPDTFPKGCWDMMVMNLVTSSTNIFVDCVIFVLPLPVLTKLRLARRKKIKLYAAYLIGLISISTSALRVSSMVLWTGSKDNTYVAAIIPIYDAVEINSGIICACLPLLGPLIKRVMNRNDTVLSSQPRRLSSRGTQDDVEEGSIESERATCQIAYESWDGAVHSEPLR